MAVHDGNGWVDCRCGQRHWGRYGAAGLLLLRPGPGPGPGLEVLLQLRAAWTHQGGTWSLPGGARDSHEDPVAAALREACEEAGVPPEEVVVLGEHPGVDHVDWSYTYVLAGTHRSVPARRTSESEDLRWLAPADVAALPLHPAFGHTWPTLSRLVADGDGPLDPS